MFVFTIDDIFSWGLFALALLVLIGVLVFNAIGGTIRRFSDKRTKRAEEALKKKGDKCNEIQHNNSRT